MSFTYDPTTARGRVRLLLSDTDASDSTKQIFTDAEIDAFLAMEGNELYAAAAAACESLAANTARSAILMRLEKLLAIDRKEIPKHFRELAMMYRKRSVSAPAEEIDSMDYNISPFGRDLSEYVGDAV